MGRERGGGEEGEVSWWGYYNWGSAAANGILSQRKRRSRGYRESFKFNLRDFEFRETVERLGPQAYKPAWLKW
jgi:hypothetical protein